MPNSVSRRSLPVRAWFGLAVIFLAFASAASAQIPGAGQQLPSPDQAQEILRNQPQLIDQLRQRIQQSGLTPDQVRSRLRAAGYPDNLLDSYVQGADTTMPAQYGPRTLDAVRALGVLSDQEADSLKLADSVQVTSDSLRAVLDSLELARADSLRCRLPGRHAHRPARRPQGVRHRDLPPSVDPVSGLAGGARGRELPPRPGRRAGADPHRRRRAVAHPRGDPRRLRGDPSGGPGLRGQPDPGRDPAAALRPARAGLLRRPPEWNRQHQVPALAGQAAKHPGLRRGRRGAPRRLPDLERRHGADRPVCRRGADDQRQLPPGDGAPGQCAGRQPRPVRLPPAREEPDQHPPADRRRRVRPGARRVRRRGRQGASARHLRARPRRDPEGRHRLRRRVRPVRRAGAGHHPPHPSAGVARVRRRGPVS